MARSPRSASYTVPFRASRLSPSPLPAFPWGSMSTRSTFRSAEARLAARLMAVVVFPTPPFWFEMQMTRPTAAPPGSVLLDAGRSTVG